jgi:hydroxymethylpyrimidine pyrophosphatase-like HAD family hydrolase
VIKLIATDLDRTLLRTDKSISAYTVNVLQHCRVRGIKIVFATARPRRTVLHFFEKRLPMRWFYTTGRLPKSAEM